MKILMVTNIYPKPDFPSQGSFVKNQVESIEKEGIDVHLLSIHAKKSRLNYLKAVFRIWEETVRSDYDLIHAHYGYSGMVSRMQFRLPVLVSYCGGDILGSPNSEGELTFEAKVDIFLGKLLSLIVPAVIVKSEGMRRKLPKENNVFVVPNGVDFELFKSVPKREARKKLKLNQKRKYVLFPANPEWPRKCFPVAQKAIRILKQKGMDVELILLHSQSQEIVPWYMNACNVMVLTSYWEGSPNVIKESMACNLPIVSVDVGDVRNVIGRCEGCYIAKRDPIDVASKLERILESNKRTTGREKRRDLEKQHVAKKIVNLYKKVSRNKNE